MTSGTTLSELAGRTVAATPPAGDRAVVASTREVTRFFGEREVLRGVDLELHADEFVALLGPSGCGKTTLIRLLAGLDEPTSGDIALPNRRAVVFQEPRLMPWERVWRNVILGMPGYARAEAVATLAEVGLEARADAWPVTLSGGEAQRASLARALVREPELLLMDEPFAALDALTRLKMHALIQRLVARHRPATLIVTHDVDEAILLADRVLVMSSGRLLTEVPVALSHPRRRDRAGFDRLRTTLLEHLGVRPYEDELGLGADPDPGDAEIVHP